jgi:ankyrin repeat protein
MSSIFSPDEYDYDTPGERLLQAVMDRSPERVRNILSTGVDIESPDRAGKTALLKAARWGYADMVDLLIAHGADVNARDRWGPALVRAAADGHLQIVRALVQAGAPIDPIDEAGMTPMMGAAQNGHAAVVRELLEYDADITRVDISGRSAEDLASSGPCRDMLRAVREQDLLDRV